MTVDVRAGPIARMFPAEAWRDPVNADGGAVFNGRAGEVVDNVDRKPDPGHPPAGLFNLDAHIHDVDTGHPVPYLDVHMTVTRDGESVFTDVALVSVARPHKADRRAA